MPKRKILVMFTADKKLSVRIQSALFTWEDSISVDPEHLVSSI